MSGAVWFASGHRPDKLGGYSQDALNLLVSLAKLCIAELQPHHVKVGMALGWDTAVAMACLELDVPYQPCIPFKGQESKWSGDQKRLYWLLLDRSPMPLEYVSEPPYAAYKMEVRNRYMVDHGERGLVLWDGSESGGTSNCVKYALSAGKPLVNAWDRYMWLRGRA